jgi:DNA gyrase subunit A
LLTATANGYGKCTELDEYSTIGRGGQGVISIKTSDRNGQVVAAVMVDASQEVVLISDKGTLVRTRVSEISVLSRNTQGVKLINLTKDELLAGVAVVDTPEEVIEEAEDNVIVDGVISDTVETQDVAITPETDVKPE